MHSIKHYPEKGEIVGTATGRRDWATQCGEFERETGIKVERPLSATVRRRADGRLEYRQRLPVAERR